MRIAWVVVASALAAACGLASIATGALLAFVALALPRTSGQGAFTLVGTLLVARHLERRRGQAVAAAHLGVTVASVVLPPLVAALILQIGWRSTYQVIAVLLLVAVLPLAGFVRPGHPAQSPFRMLRTPPPAPTQRPSGSCARVSRTSPRPQRHACCSSSPRRPPSVRPSSHTVSILAERGIGLLAADGVLGVLGATSAIGVVPTGALVDRVRSRTALLVLSALVLTATLVLLGPTKTAAYGAFAILGLGMGAAGVVNGTIWARTFGTSPLGHIQGTAQSSMITAAAAAPLVPAISPPATGSYQSALIALGVMAATALAVAARPPART